MPRPTRAAHPSAFKRALLVSLVLHALLVAWLVRFDRVRSPPPPLRTPMRISLRPLPPRSPAPERPARPGTTAATPPRPSPPATASRPTIAEPPAPAAHPLEKPGVHPPAADAPIELFPGGAVAKGAGPAAPGDSGASTKRDAPDSRDVEGKRVLQRVETWRRQNLADRLVATGVDDYFKDFRRALQSHMGPPPPGGGPKHGDLSAGQRWINAWLEALEEADPSHDPPPKGERMPNRNTQDVTGRMDEFIANQLGPMAVQPSFATQRLLQRAAVIGLPVAVLRIVQRADGSIESTELVASSGDKAFDAYVVDHAPLALAAVPAPPARQGAGLHPDGTRTEWAFYRAEGGCGVMLLRVY